MKVYIESYFNTVEIAEWLSEIYENIPGVKIRWSMNDYGQNFRECDVFIVMMDTDLSANSGTKIGIISNEIEHGKKKIIIGIDKDYEFKDTDYFSRHMIMRGGTIVSSIEEAVEYMKQFEDEFNEE